MENTIIRDSAKSKGIKLWMVAEALHIQDSAFSRKLRRELPKEEQEKILTVIEQLARAKQEAV